MSPPAPELLLPSPPNPTDNKEDKNKEEGLSESLVFDASVLKYMSQIPSEFIWPDHEKPCLSPPELQVPPIDLMGFLSGDPRAMAKACSQVREACRSHGFFLVVNHGVDAGLIARAHELMDRFFGLKLREKQKAQRKIGEHIGYASSFTGRFTSNLPWKETLSFRYSAAAYDDQFVKRTVEEYFVNVMGEDFRDFG